MQQNKNSKTKCNMSNKSKNVQENVFTKCYIVFFIVTP